ncbi:hypothetical protein [Paracoccus liaowanqingii]|uniref:hypothetical protein n=1 Tax=Paracoccus liaowanqingii TaxID=2560053 RepID=UPI00143DA745|nr:hypothetical protein [Paracoccus liaowanqingii]
MLHSILTRPRDDCRPTTLITGFPMSDIIYLTLGAGGFLAFMAGIHALARM